MYRNMVTSLLDHERIETTDAKAKEVRRIAERMITLGKRGDLHAKRRALRVIRSRDVAAKVFDELADRYKDRAGGYTRVLKLGNRKGDAAAVSIVELVDGTGGAAPVEEAAPKKKKAAKKAEPRKKAESKKASSKKTSSKKTPSKKTASKKSESKKKTAKKKTESKAATKKKTKKKSTSKKSASKASKKK
jgi:large subunit ribosomal protein L17